MSFSWIEFWIFIVVDFIDGIGMIEFIRFITEDSKAIRRSELFETYECTGKISFTLN